MLEVIGWPNIFERYEEAMDDDRKTVIEKFTDAVKGAASTVMEAASNAAGGAMKSTAERISPDVVEGSEEIFIPETIDPPQSLPRCCRHRKNGVLRRSNASQKPKQARQPQR